MSHFQQLTLTLIGGLLLWDVWRWVRGARLNRLRLFWWVVCVAAAVAIAFPDLVQAVANFLGIGRGADVVLYLFVLTFLGTSFFLYARCRQLQQQITEIVRHIALEEGVRDNLLILGDGKADRSLHEPAQRHSTEVRG